jgi:hypothetical protein
MFRVKTSLFLASVSIFATAAPATAQSIAPPQVPLSDTDCPYPNVNFPVMPPCTTPGTRTTTPTIVTVTPGAVAGTSNINVASTVTYNGNLAIDGAPVVLNPGFGFNFDASQFFSPAAATVNVTSAYNGSGDITGVPNASVPFVTSGFTSGPIAAFQQYSFTSNTVNSIGVNVVNNLVTDQATKVNYYYSLSTPNPTSITGGNSAALSGRFLNDPTTGSGGALQFGTLSGNATLLTANPNQILTPSGAFLDANGNPTGGWTSPYALQYNVTAKVTTTLDETGLVTPQVAVTNGINMNGSKITNLGAGVNPTDAVNKAQLDAVATTANAGVTAEAAAQGTANTALTNAAAAQTTANTAVTNAAAAQTTANTALTNAATAQTTANTALTNASTAQTAANGAQTTANTASTKADAAQSTANTALTNAATAQTTANTAVTTANAANTTALAAQATANAVDAKATNALTIATQTAALISTGPAGNQVAIGSGSTATNGKAVSVGYQNTASGNGAVAIGDPNVATGVGAVAIGANNTATGQGSVALGNASVANGQSTVVLGDSANATGASAVALGQSAQATFAKSAAIGSGAVTARAGQVVLGGAASSVTVGDIAASTAAQVGTTDIATVDSSGTIGRDTTVRPVITSLQTTQVTQGSAIAALQAFNSNAGGRLSSLEAGQASLFNLAQLNQKEARRGIAAVAAMAPAHFPSAPGKTSYSANVATYRGEVGYSLSVAHRFSGDTPFALTASVSHAGGDDTAARVGVAGEF